MNNRKSGSREWGHSLRRMPWDQENNIPTNTEKLISSTVDEWYLAKHREASAEEISLINSLIPATCPHCRSKDYIKKGFSSGRIQRYQCKCCDQKFSPLTNTIFDSKKIPFSEWIEFLLHLFEFHSIVTSARDNRNASSTGKYWFIKVFSVLRDVQSEIKLHGNVYIDEMYFSKYPRDLVKKNGSYFGLDKKIDKKIDLIEPEGGPIESYLKSKKTEKLCSRHVNAFTTWQHQMSLHC